MIEDSKEINETHVLSVFEMFKFNEEFDKKLFPLGLNISIIDGLMELMFKHMDLKEHGEFIEKLAIRLFDSHIRNIRTKIWGTSVLISNVLPKNPEENWQKLNKDISLINLEDIEMALGFKFGTSMRGAILSSKILKATGAKYWSEYLEQASYNLFENIVLWNKDRAGIVIQPLMLSLLQEYKLGLYPLMEMSPEAKKITDAKIMALDFNDTKERLIKIYNHIIDSVLSVDNKAGRYVGFMEDTNLENIGLVENRYGLEVKIPQGKSIGTWEGRKEKLGLVQYISFKKDCPEIIKDLMFKALSEAFSFNGLLMNEVSSMIDPVFDEHRMRCDLEEEKKSKNVMSSNRKLKF